MSNEPRDETDEERDARKWRNLSAETRKEIEERYAALEAKHGAPLFPESPPAFVETSAEGAHIMTKARRKALARKLGGRIL